MTSYYLFNNKMQKPNRVWTMINDKLLIFFNDKLLIFFSPSVIKPSSYWD